VFGRLVEFLNRPDSAGIVYRLGQTKPESVMVDIALPGWHGKSKFITNDLPEQETVLVVNVLQFVGAGWHTTGDAQLANAAADLARSRHDQHGPESCEAIAIDNYTVDKRYSHNRQAQPRKGGRC
jgi:hypothetical protein